MYTSMLEKAIREANLATFGEEAHIYKVSAPSTVEGFASYAYVHHNNVTLEDPDAMAVVKDLADVESSYYIIFEKRLNKAIHEATADRPHIQIPTVIRSQCVKAIWQKVLHTKRFMAVSMPFEKLCLGPKKMTACLPEGYQFPPEFNGYSHLESVEILYDTERRGFQNELGCRFQQFGDKIAQERALALHVETYVLGHIAVRAKDETMMLQFLKNCKNLVMNT